MLNWESEKAVNMSESSSDEAEVSSNADSDFIDVPEIDSEMDATFLVRSKFPLPPPFLMNPPPLNENVSHDTKLEVVINPGEMCTVKDDIFADIFDKPDVQKTEDTKLMIDDIKQSSNKIQETEIKAKSEDVKMVKSIVQDNVEDVETVGVIESDEDVNEDEKMKEKSDDSIEPDPESESEIILPKSDEFTTAKASGPFKQSSTFKIQSILSGLDNQISAVTKLSLNDLLGPKSSDTIEQTTTNDIEVDFLKSLAKPSPSKEQDITPTKNIPQPFFVKKTPPSSNKKSPGSTKKETDTTPSKVSKSLTDIFDSIPSTSTNVVCEKDSIEMAANVLRENKSKAELEDIAEMLNQERRDLAAERNKKDRLGVSITEQMSMECMELLRLFGVPYIVAPMEAEAQCAYLNEIKLTDGTITDDSDIWLFGGQTVYKNFFDQNKHVMEFKSENIQRLFHLDRHKLIQLSFLVGSDYTEGKCQHK